MSQPLSTDKTLLSQQWRIAKSLEWFSGLIKRSLKPPHRVCLLNCTTACLACRQQNNFHENALSCARNRRIFDDSTGDEPPPQTKSEQTSSSSRRCLLNEACGERRRRRPLISLEILLPVPRVAAKGWCSGHLSLCSTSAMTSSTTGVNLSPPFVMKFGCQ